MILPSVAEVLTLQEEIKHNILAFPDEKSATGSKSVMVEALGDHNIPAEERTIDRLLDEGILFMFAGTELIARALIVAMFHLLNA